MIVRFLFSAPNGDIHASPVDLVKPFKTTPSENHPFLTLDDYFNSIKSFTLKDNGIALSYVLGENIDIKRIKRMLIRSEKHGALYHIASVEIFTDNQSCKLAVSTAVSEKDKSWLAHEYNMLNFLDRSFNLPFLPKPYFRGNVVCCVGSYKESLSMFAAQWFEGYNEWHFSLGERETKPRVCIWDQKFGHRFASQKETFEIFRQASKILTLFYDMKNFREIFPWHHAAGDFVVRKRNNVTDVKLTTARNYKSLVAFNSQKEINPMIAVIYFFLNMTLRMRLDRLDGVGKTVWAREFCVEATTTGFFDALRLMEGQGRYHLGKVSDLLALLKAFSREELGRLFFSVLDYYRQEDPVDFSVINTHLKSHVNQFYRVLQGFHL